MTSFVEIDSQKFQNVSEAAKLTGYSRDYIGRLAREKKIDATQIGRQWFVSIPSLQKYSKSAEFEMKTRQQKLSEERKREREATKRISGKVTRRSGVVSGKKIGARILATSVLALGVGFGVLLNTTSLANITAQKQVANVPQGNSFPEVTQEFPVATGDVVEIQEGAAMDFSQESMTISTMDGDGQGVLLLPNQGDKKLTEKDVQQLFSDPVKIVKDESGNRYVVRTKTDGSEERLPFAVVPVVKPETL
jgi:excisionase family DNA binding protein